MFFQSSQIWAAFLMPKTSCFPIPKKRFSQRRTEKDITFRSVLIYLCSHQQPSNITTHIGERKMSDTLLPIVQTINSYLSDYILFFMLIAVGLWYSFKTRFVQVRCFGEGMRRVFGNLTPVSYTHLDVYKRQILFKCWSGLQEASVKKSCASFSGSFSSKLTGFSSFIKPIAVL